MHRILLVLFAVCLVTSCSQVARIDADPEVETIRAQYLSENPHGQYNDHIARGEIVRGMNFVEVLASWGVPTRRERQKDGVTEAWTYRVHDRDPSDIATYELQFADRMLTGWRYSAASAGLSTLSSSSSSSARLSSPSSGGLSGSSKPVN